jgi:hypothetical protein
MGRAAQNPDEKGGAPCWPYAAASQFALRRASPAYWLARHHVLSTQICCAKRPRSAAPNHPGAKLRSLDDVDSQNPQIRAATSATSSPRRHARGRGIGAALLDGSDRQWGSNLDSKCRSGSRCMGAAFGSFPRKTRMPKGLELGPICDPAQPHDCWRSQSLPLETKLGTTFAGNSRASSSPSRGGWSRVESRPRR